MSKKNKYQDTILDLPTQSGTNSQSINPKKIILTIIIQYLYRYYIYLVVMLFHICFTTENEMHVYICFIFVSLPILYLSYCIYVVHNKCVVMIKLRGFFTFLIFFHLSFLIIFKSYSSNKINYTNFFFQKIRIILRIT